MEWLIFLIFWKIFIKQPCPTNFCFLFQHCKLNIGIGENGMRLCFEIGLVRLKNILHISLWVQIDKWKPSTLYLNLQFVPFFNGMEHIL